MAIQTSELKKYNYFSSLSEEALESLSQKLGVMNYPARAVIFNEGDQGDFFYFVKQGRLEVTKTTKFGQVARLSVVSSGQGLGEMSLLTGDSRCCTIKTLTPVVLYALTQADFAGLISRESGFKKALLKKAADSSSFNKIKMLQPFALLEPDRMYALLARMQDRTYGLGEDIIVQGEKGDYYYIIKSGRVAVLKKSKGEQDPKQVALLEEGDAFGEEALIRDDPRNATCRAAEETTVYVLDKVDFDQIMKGSFLDNIFAEDISVQTYRDKYVVIDARVPAEYEEEHIEGALTIPVEILRKQYTELDPKKAYITYCTNDSRGMVAAFLLKNHGFNAKCLRGGISSWEGPTAVGPAVSA
jgi:CRP-like cAMP-binding protein